MMPPEDHLPWATAPSDQGSQICGWCHRAIYGPALPCSVEPVEGLARMVTTPGLGARCQYELATRDPAVLEQAGLA